jgi:MYXO-CTERM domain-containing protein
VKRYRAASLVLLSGLVACGETDDGIAWLQRPLQALCTVNVSGSGLKQVETDYLPHVVTCENGAADIEALKAQAVAARTFMYYKIKTEGGTIGDGQSDQVYTCSAQPQQKHYDAVNATAGQVLIYQGVVICSFYVAGAKPSTATCVAASGDSDPTNTEKYVTYNEGKTGSSVTQSTLGWVDPANKYNRGCKSQNGAHCLSLKGKPYHQILPFYYGADIQLVTATGSCVTPQPDASVPTPDKSVVQPDTSPPFDGLKPPGDGASDRQQAVDGSGGDGPPPFIPGRGNVLEGGCSIAAGPTLPWPLLAAALLGLLAVRRRVWLGAQSHRKSWSLVVSSRQPRRERSREDARQNSCLSLARRIDALSLGGMRHGGWRGGAGRGDLLQPDLP